MGIFRLLLLAGVAIGVAHPALAQDGGAQGGDAPPAAQDFRLDPARDPNRATTPQRAGPEIDNRPAVALPTAPVVTPPPAVAPTVNPTITRPAARPVVRAQNTTPLPAAEDIAAPQQAPSVPTGSDTPAVVAPPASEPSALPSAQDVPAATTPEKPMLWWPWAVAGLLLAGAPAYLFTRRRKRPVEPEVAAGPVPVPFVPTPSSPGPPKSAAPPRPRPTPVVAPQPAPVVAAHPVSLHFTPLSARITQAGAQIAYRLELRNEGRAAINGLAVAAFIANADARQPQALGAFYDDPFAPEAHRIASIAPGGAVTVEGDLYLSGDRLNPIEVQGRALLIPLVAFKAISLDGDDMGRGAFIIGQESTPPGARMAPFRLDQGPREFRRIGSRPAQELVAA